MPEYTVSVTPPHGGAEPFDIPEWDAGAAADTANRYRERGWGARVIDRGAPSAPAPEGGTDRA